MATEQRVKALLELYKQQMDHFQHTQQIEWKANFGIWSLLAVSIYVVSKEPIHIHRGGWTLSALALAIFIHAWWLLKVHSSEIADKRYWTRYRDEALRLIRGVQSPHEDEVRWNRSNWDKIVWLLLEVMVTFLLCAFLFFSLPPSVPAGSILPLT